ncbi:hypothetical protein S83_067530, partial [Arachis hypogaea]
HALLQNSSYLSVVVPETGMTTTTTSAHIASKKDNMLRGCFESNVYDTVRSGIPLQ